MNSYPIKGRHGHSMTFYEQEDGRYRVELTGECSAYTRFGFDEGPVYRFVDPPGGPFVSVGQHLDDFNREAPKKKITAIVNESGTWLLEVE